MKKKRKWKKLASLRSIKLKAWRIMSVHVRKSAADHTDQCHCVTCGTYDHWKRFDAGHYIHISKQHPLSYDKRNIHPQCRACNFYKSKGIEYAHFMYKTYGPAVIEELLERKKERYLKRDALEAFIANPMTILQKVEKIPIPEFHDPREKFTEVPF